MCGDDIILKATVMKAIFFSADAGLRPREADVVRHIQAIRLQIIADQRRHIFRKAIGGKMLFQRLAVSGKHDAIENFAIHAQLHDLCGIACGEYGNHVPFEIGKHLGQVDLARAFLTAKAVYGGDKASFDEALPMQACADKAPGEHEQRCQQTGQA